MELIKLVTFITVFLCIILILLTYKIFSHAYRAIFDIRRALKQYAYAFSGAKYRGFDTVPTVYGVIEGYEFKLGATLMRRRDGGLSASLFEKIKLKKLQKISWIQRDSLALEIANERFVIESNWLTKYHDISHDIPSESVAYSRYILGKSSHNLKSLIEIAHEIDTGFLNIKREISKSTTEARREFLIGSLAVIGAVCFFWVLWYFGLLR